MDSRNCRWGRGIAAAALTAGLLWAPGSSPAFSEFEAEQELDIDSNTWNQVLVYYYASGDTAFSDIALGDRTIRDLFFVANESFTGAFLFDYTEGKFTNGYYATKNDF